MFLTKQLRRRKNARIRSHAASHNQQQQGQGFGQGASSPCSTNTSQPSPEDVILGMMSPCQNPYSPVINGSGGVFSAHQSPIATLLEVFVFINKNYTHKKLCYIIEWKTTVSKKPRIVFLKYNRGCKWKYIIQTLIA